MTPETSLGFELIEFSERVLGVVLFPWQKWLVVHALELNEDGTFRFRRVIVLVARQNGKTTLFKVWALWRLFADRAEGVLGTAHDLATAEKTWEQTLSLARSVPELGAGIAKESNTNGNKYFRLANNPAREYYGGEYLVRAATGGGGRGASIELVFMDELREHKDYSSWSAVTKTTNAISRGQIVAMSNAGDASSVVLNDLQARATQAIETGITADTQTGLFEWSGGPDCDVWDRDAWAQANPSLGYSGMTEATLAADCETDPEDVYRTEVLCQRVKSLDPSVFPEGAWDGCAVPANVAVSHVEGARLDVTVEVSHDRSMTYLVACGESTLGKPLIEVVAERAGTAWVVPWLVERAALFGRVIVQARGAPASSLIPALKEASTGVDGEALWEVLEWGGSDLTGAHGSFYDAVREADFLHLGQPVLDAGAESGRIKPLGDSWVFDRAKSPVDVSPVIGAVGSLWAFSRPREAAQTSVYDDEDAELMIL
ncbi:terminase [Tomitella gaofuii]|uniref:terminase n=1 Tax=Tomitella gaofuii TaxID=2760083 RepID=UPI0015FDBE0B|nr:terminase [Tomitella gaofuii]